MILGPKAWVQRDWRVTSVRRPRAWPPLAKPLAAIGQGAS